MLTELFIFGMLLTGFFLILYLPRLRAWFGAFKKQEKLYNPKQNRFAIIIPAKDESAIISMLLSSIYHQSYDRRLMDVYVVVDRPDDPTIGIVERAGYCALVNETQRCKGDALDFALSYLLENKPNTYDAYYLADADCLLELDCIEQMNNALASGAEVLQSKKLVKNYLSRKRGTNTLASSCNGIIWTLIDDMGNRFKSDHGITCMTIGTGLVLTARFAQKLGGWPYRNTLTEDMELMNDLAVRGTSTFYYEYSIIYVEEAAKLSVTNLRRTRWLTGLIDSKRIYERRLNANARRSSRKFRDVYFVKALWPVFGFIGTLCTVGIVMGVLAGVLFMQRNALCSLALKYAFWAFGLIYLSFFMMTGMAIHLEPRNAPKTFMLRLGVRLFHPIFYMGYIPIITRAFCNLNTEEWKPIERVDFLGKQAGKETDNEYDHGELSCYTEKNKSA